MGWKVYKIVEGGEEELQGIIDQNGKANFPVNLSDEEIKYRVTYDTNNGSQCDIIVTQVGNSCAFDYEPAEGDIPEEGGSFTFGTLSDVGESITIEVEVKRGAEYLTGGVINKNGNSLVGTVSENESGTRTIEYVIKSNGNECERHTIHQPGNTCKCTCSQLRKEITDSGEYFYTYDGRSHSDVPFMVVSTEKSFDCEVTANKIDDGITSISIVPYASSTKSMWSQELQNICNELEQTRKVFIVYGSITSSDTLRTLNFTLSVCESTCMDKTEQGEEVPYHVFQRCACGLDNCTVTYGDGSENDRPLYLSSCGGGWAGTDPSWNWIQSDSICVEYLKFVGAYKFINKYDPSNLRKPTSVSTPQRVDNLGTSELELCQGFISSTDKRVKLNPAYVCTYGEDHNTQNSYRNGCSATGGKLITVDANHNNSFESDVADFYLYLIQTASSYEPGSTYPLKAMCQYMGNADPLPPDTDGKLREQVWELRFKTSSDKIIGGGDDGKCALSEFNCYIYKAPRGYHYGAYIPGTFNKQLELC